MVTRARIFLGLGGMGGGGLPPGQAPPAQQGTHGMHGMRGLGGGDVGSKRQGAEAGAGEEPSGKRGAKRSVAATIERMEKVRGCAREGGGMSGWVGVLVCVRESVSVSVCVCARARLCAHVCV